MSPKEMNANALSGLWAKKYVDGLLTYAWDSSASTSSALQTVNKLLDNLRFASAQAWTQTERLLSQELPRHRVDPNLIDPWMIAQDSRIMYEKAAECYKLHLRPEEFSVAIASLSGEIRKKHTAQDPRVLGFLSMQFHYTGRILLEKIPDEHKTLIGQYFKVMDDSLYMPIQEAFDAAARCDYHSPRLVAVRSLLPHITTIAASICSRIADLYPTHVCYHGSLNDSGIRISSIRDVEMFQIYLCLSVLTESLQSIQQELFPLCVMLYPALNVSWILVRDMVQKLQEEIEKYLDATSFHIMILYLKGIQDMFSLEVFPENDPIWSSHPNVLKYMDQARDLLKGLSDPSLAR
jgi:hypothetical protein